MQKSHSGHYLTVMLNGTFHFLFHFLTRQLICIYYIYILYFQQYVAVFVGNFFVLFVQIGIPVIFLCKNLVKT